MRVVHRPPLDYHKLRYFWNAARAGSLAGAARLMGVAQPTVSTQVQSLEAQLDGLVLDRSARGLELTDLGKAVFKYADQIFELGAELERALDSGAAHPAPDLIVGVADGVPKLVVRSLLQPAFERNVRLECREWRTDILLNELADHRMDLVIADVALSPDLPGRVMSYEAGASGIVLLGAQNLVPQGRRQFPRSLTGMPFLLPVKESPLRRALDVWFDANQVIPQIAAEIDDRALMNHLGQSGLGLFPAALMLEKELCRQYKVARIAVLKSVKEHYFVFTTRRRLKHAAVAAICGRVRRQFTAATSAAGTPA